MGLRYSCYIECPTTKLESDSLGSSPNSYLTPYHQISETRRFQYHGSYRTRESSDVSNSKFVTYGCRRCRTHLSSSTQIMSKDYRGKTGDAYLMTKVVNVIEGSVETRPMITGDYLVCDILCHWCKSLLGWKYLESERKDQRYKEGKYILEVQTICRCD
ncbi:hypothetical protein HG537_0B03630 [Torulaspora globosa]|uniref:Protein yippee-like n=1 Tax=Torulaspora globosa TaxID=48254 RepID=A0A7H9HP43_9SACH|nr:hypothetical protein HG537_0B03630 [Torulaspora sp. CBS 2947]